MWKSSAGPSDPIKATFLLSAQKEFQTAFLIYPDYFEPYFQLAESYHYENNDSLAILNYEKALLLMPENYDAIRNLSIAIVRISENGKSTAMIEKLIGRVEIVQLINTN